MTTPLVSEMPLSPFSFARAFMDAALDALPFFPEKAERRCARIIEQVARKYYLRPSDLTGRLRWAEIMVARQEAYWRCRNEITVRGAPLSTIRIGRAFGGRDHSTIISGINRHKERLAAKQAGVTVSS